MNESLDLESGLLWRGLAAEHLVEITAYIIANGNHRGVHVGYPHAGTEGGELHEEHHLEGR